MTDLRERTRLYEALKRCTPAQFGEVVLSLPVDRAHIPAAPAPIAERAQVLIRLVEQSPALSENLRAALLGSAPGLLPNELTLRYLEWVERELDTVWVFHGTGTRRRLMRVYVRLLNRELARAWSQRGRVVDEDGHPCSGEVELEHTLGALLDKHPRGRWTLQGDPGAGKSTQLRHLAIQRARRARARLEAGEDLDPGTVPIVASLPELAERLEEGVTVFDLVADEVTSTVGYRELKRDRLRAELEQLAKRGVAALLLDGFDEVRPELREDALAELLEYDQHLDAPLVMTSRRFGYQHPSDDFVELALLPLDRDRQAKLLNNWRLPPRLIASILEQVQTHPPMQDMAGNPFLLTLLAFLAREGLRTQRPEPLPRRRAALYEAVVARFVRGCARHPEQMHARVGLAPDELHAGLRELALSLLQEHAGPWTTEELQRHLAGIPRLAACMRASANLVADIAADTGLLEPVGRAQARWTFRHRSFLECLAAEALNARGLAAIQAFAVRVSGQRQWWNPWSWNRVEQIGRWAEVYALLAGLSDEEPVAFLRQLRRSNEALALRALANVENVAPDVLIAEFGFTGSLELVRELMARIEKREALAGRLLELSRKTADEDTRLYLAAALLAIGADAELAKLCRRAGGARMLGLGERAWVEVSAGTFTMGDRDRGRHSVTLTNRYELLATSVTQALFAVITGTNPSHFTGDLRRPVETVSWSEARAFCVAWSKLQKRVIELPTEAEWEYACRAGSLTRFCFGDDEAQLGEYAWYGVNSGNATHPVAKKRPNAWGLHDMHGNVWEWCSDGLRRYEVSPVENPVVSIEDVQVCVVRGGSFWNEPWGLRSARRDVRHVEGWDLDRGFRCVRRPRHP